VLNIAQFYTKNVWRYFLLQGHSFIVDWKYSMINRIKFGKMKLKTMTKIMFSVLIFPKISNKKKMLLFIAFYGDAHRGFKSKKRFLEEARWQISKYNLEGQQDQTCSLFDHKRTTCRSHDRERIVKLIVTSKRQNNHFLLFLSTIAN